MRKSGLSLAALAAGLTLSPAVAQEPILLDEIVVSGGFTPILAQRYGRAVSVLTAAEIERRGLRSVQDALRALPGVSVNSGGANYTQVRIRGGEARHTLILIDGIEAAGGDGEYILSGLETANIERIEVLRGPQSVYYGSNASTGVINIVTRKGQGGRELSSSLEAGDATSGSVFVAQRGDGGGLSLSLAQSDDPGYDFSGDGGERDGTRRGTAILSGDILLGEGLKLGFTYRRAEEAYEFDSTDWAATDAAGYVVDDPNQSSARDEMTTGVFAEFAGLDGRLTHRLGYELTRNAQSYNGGGETETETEALKYRLSLGLDGLAVAEAEQLLTFFAEAERDASSSTPAYGRQARSVAAEYRGTLGAAFDFQAGLRYDDNDVFRDAATWTLGASYRLAGEVRLHASAGTGAVNPSYFELYADAWGYSGNPDLEPERNRSFDIGIEFPVFGGLIDVTYFNEVLQGEITDVSTGPGTFSFVNQTGESRREGLEVGGEMQVSDRLGLRLGYSYTRARNPDGSVEIRRPEHEAKLGATLGLFGGRGAVSADLRHVAGNSDTQFWGAYETLELPDHTTVDLALRYDLTDRVALTGRITNLTDSQAVETWGYAARGRTYYVGLDARF